MIGGMDRRERSINRADGHVETQSKISKLSKSQFFDQLIDQIIKEWTHWQKVADNRKEQTPYQDRKGALIVGADASTEQGGK